MEATDLNDLLTILEGDAVANLRTLETGSVQCCVTSPPFWGLRDYGANGQLGLEKTPEEYVAKMVEVFREVRRVLRKDGTLWLNLGDSYARAAEKGGSGTPNGRNTPEMSYGLAQSAKIGSSDGKTGRGDRPGTRARIDGLKEKDLVGIPWMVAFALRADGWWLRSDIIWAKPNPMPESVTDRPTKSHEYIFLLTKSASYFYDAEAIKEGKTWSTVNDDRTNDNGHRRERGYPGAQSNGGTNLGGNEGSRNKRSIWTIATQPYPEAHFATFPEEIPKLCIMAGTRAGDTVLDPFAGSGTTGMVALELGRKAILIELNPKYCDLIRQRCNVTPGLALA